ncbi:GGDEF domain-containing protein [Aurantiacibacter xanthus]|uniref:GGDEF domain-containing protein n=1 Tax=Aurantiacibacter xanthus TaxID=1784712 RepID=UPI001C726040|nr:GGDEF domain-containing protein [Aurantiacibacter xanthus]
MVVRLRDPSHQWTSAQYGATGLGCLLEQSIALAAADHVGPLIAPDAARHPLLRDHPLVTSDAKVLSFAGIAAFTDTDDSTLSEAVGVICALSEERREFGPEATALLESMSALMRSLYAQNIALHRHAHNSAALEQDMEGTRRLQRQFRQAERIASIGSWRMAIDDGDLHWSEGVYAIHELPHDANISVADAVNYYAGPDRQKILTAIERAVQTGESYDFEADFIGAKGNAKRVRVAGEVELSDGRPAALVGVIQDISDKHRLMQELEHRATTDSLTGLPNRDKFNDKLADAMRATMENKSPLGVVIIDLDNLRSVNDNAGQAAGDELLCRASAILRGSWLRGSFAARLGGDELVLLLQDDRHIAQLPAVLDRLAAELAAPLDYNGRAVPTGASLGASILHPGGNCSGIELLENADRALNAAKRESEVCFLIAPPINCADCTADCHADRPWAPQAAIMSAQAAVGLAS